MTACSHFLDTLLIRSVFPDPGLIGADYHHLAWQSNQADPGGDQGRGNPFSTSIRILPDLLNVATDLGKLAHDIFNHLLMVKLNFLLNYFFQLYCLQEPGSTIDRTIKM